MRTRKLIGQTFVGNSVDKRKLRSILAMGFNNTPILNADEVLCELIFYVNNKAYFKKEEEQEGGV